MQIKDLPGPVMSAKADWLPGTHWIGFTPTDGSGAARERCRATITSQIKWEVATSSNVPRVSLMIPTRASRTIPNVLLSVLHTRRSLANSLPFIVFGRHPGRSVSFLAMKKNEHRQDMWADGDKRYRWSVAFGAPFPVWRSSARQEYQEPART